MHEILVGEAGKSDVWFGNSKIKLFPLLYEHAKTTPRIGPSHIDLFIFLAISWQPLHSSLLAGTPFRQQRCNGRASRGRAVFEINSRYKLARALRTGMTEEMSCKLPETLLLAILVRRILQRFWLARKFCHMLAVSAMPCTRWWTLVSATPPKFKRESFSQFNTIY